MTYLDTKPELVIALPADVQLIQRVNADGCQLVLRGDLETITGLLAEALAEVITGDVAGDGEPVAGLCQQCEDARAVDAELRLCQCCIDYNVRRCS